MSYLKLGWNWVRLAITQQWHIQVYLFLSSLLVLNLPWLPKDSMTFHLIVNSPYSATFQLLSFVSQAGNRSYYLGCMACSMTPKVTGSLHLHINPAMIEGAFFRQHRQ